MDEVVKAAAKLDYHDLDPYVATVASGISARRISEPDKEGKETIELKADEFYDKKVSAELGLHNGPDAPLMVILPGVYGNRSGSLTKAFKKIALERGMNYIAMDNPLQHDVVNSGAQRHPGNIQTEAEATHALLRSLREQKPEYCKQITLAGYSYGGLLAANVARVDEERGGQRVIQGGVVTVSPPENLNHSMRELDSLRELYAEGSGSITATTILYTKDIGALGYENFPESDLAARGEGTNITEINIADSYGSRNEMKDMVAQVDSVFEHHQLPSKWRHPLKRREVLNNMTYDQYNDGWFLKDPWMAENNMTTEQLAADNSYSQALANLNDTPVYTLLSQDDYILNGDDIQTFQELENSEDKREYTQVMDRGGHVGLLFNPEVQNLIGDFAHSAVNL